MSSGFPVSSQLCKHELPPSPGIHLRRFSPLFIGDGNRDYAANLRGFIVTIPLDNPRRPLGGTGTPSKRDFLQTLYHSHLSSNPFTHQFLSGFSYPADARED
jgi:hypothetical protein